MPPHPKSILCILIAHGRHKTFYASQLIFLSHIQHFSPVLQQQPLAPSVSLSKILSPDYNNFFSPLFSLNCYRYPSLLPLFGITLLDHLSIVFSALRPSSSATSFLLLLLTSSELNFSYQSALSPTKISLPQCLDHDYHV